MTGSSDNKNANISYETALAETVKYLNGNELGAKAFVGKYAMKDNNGNLLETTPDDMHRRMAAEFARIESKYSNALSADSIYQRFHKFKELIPQGSPMAGIGNPHQLLSLGNCFVIPSCQDSYGSILNTDQRQAQIMKRRGGVGHDISNIRPKGLPTANAASTTDGIGVFMERFSNTCREVAQGGRRGALMLTLSCHHPEIETFINIKRDLKKVTGANISSRFTDEFMNAVVEDRDVELRWPVNSKTPKVTKRVSAHGIWKQFVRAAWEAAEPGALFWDTVTSETPSDCYSDVGFGSISTNPCGEIILEAWGACRLLLVNCMGFLNEDVSPGSPDRFDFPKFAAACYDAQRLMDDLVDLELEAIEKIIEKIKSDPEDDDTKRPELELWNNISRVCAQGRRTGLGLTGVGDLVAAVGLRYGSQESVEYIDRLYKVLAVNAFRSSVDMAMQRGAFPVYDYSKEKGHPFLTRVLEASDQYDDLGPVYRDRYLKYGRRNIADTTTPPAGTTSMLALVSEKYNIHGTTSGIEPAYLISYKRRKKINPNDVDARVDYVDELGDKWTEFEVRHGGYERWCKEQRECGVAENLISPENSPYWKATSADVDWKMSVDLQAAAQKWIAHSISKTCNLPKDATEELVSEVYLRAWKSGCKGFTVYRDGSRSGVLVSSTELSTDNNKDKQQPFGSLVNHAAKRPNELACDVYHSTVQGEKWTIFVGKLDGRPYEIMGGLSKFIKIPKRVKAGKLSKHNGDVNPARYDFHFDYEELPEDEMVISDVGNIFENPVHSGYTRMLSLSMRHGVPVQFIVEQLTKAGDRESDLFSISKVLARVLKNYIVDGTKIQSNSKKCSVCGSKSLAYKDGCVQCLDCGYSRCS